MWSVIYLWATAILLWTGHAASAGEGQKTEPADTKSSIRVLQSDEVWTNEPQLVVALVETVRANRDVDAIPDLVAHIDFTPVIEADMTMGNISQVYPVTACLISLGNDSARGIVDHLRRASERPSDQAIAQMKRVLVALLGKTGATEFLTVEHGKEAHQESRNHLSLLLDAVQN
jgi:hypothetical protein